MCHAEMRTQELLMIFIMKLTWVLINSGDEAYTGRIKIPEVQKELSENMRHNVSGESL